MFGTKGVLTAALREIVIEVQIFNSLKKAEDVLRTSSGPVSHK